MLARPWRKINPFGFFWPKKKANRAFDEEQRGRQSERMGHRYRWQRDARIRRLILLILTLVQTAAAGVLMTNALQEQGNSFLRYLVLSLFLILFFWVSAGFWTAIAGFFVLTKGGDKHDVILNQNIGIAPMPCAHSNPPKTAIIMPICNEDVARVFAGLRATYESLVRYGHLQQFDFYVLSDSSDTDICTAELGAWSALCRVVGGYGHIFYRRRRRRIKRKMGNIADFCRRWGKNYRYMIVLDADSIMTGKCLTTLVELMEKNLNAGIIQTAPCIAGRETLYARIQQFAARVYGPLYTAGLHFWQLGESHYWGHNAIIRIAPFMRHCALAPLPGSGPLSGDILSHDFIEAALMRRAGWAVWIAYDLPGSYEEIPPNLLDELQRDQRWCRGNIMNFRLILERGIHPVHRAVFATGLMAYLSSLLWLTFLVLSTILLTNKGFSSEYATSTVLASASASALLNPKHAFLLFSITVALLTLPKLLAIVRICYCGASQFGGAACLILSMILELLFSMLAAPIRMLFHSRFVLDAWTGSRLQWKSPSRNDTETSWSEAMRKHGTQTLFGAVWIIGVYLDNQHYFLWFLPVVGALLFSIPLSVLSSRVALGKRLRKMKILLTPEEYKPPAELRATEIYHDNAPILPKFADAVIDPETNALVCACTKKRTDLPSEIRPDRFRLLQLALRNGPSNLSLQQRHLLLNDPATLSQLHVNVWRSSHVHPQWRKMIADYNWKPVDDIPSLNEHRIQASLSSTS